MLERELRQAILSLHSRGHGVRKIARSLELSRNTVRQVLRSDSPEVPPFEREEQLTPYLARITELHNDCKGNLVRVAEELERELEQGGVRVAYSTLTAFCRRQGIGIKPPKPAGRYHFGPGQEMQHDTSPHDVTLGGSLVRLQCASLVLCYSRMVYLQLYPRWTRFECRVFLSEAIGHFGGSAAHCMLDNSSVIRWHGTGKHMVPAPQMQAFSKRFGFEFVAHELGDANRSARVERNFHYVENNFYPGRTFAALDDANAQLRAWCDKVNNSPRRLRGEVKAIATALFATERSALRALPLHVPEVYDLFSRRVDVEGYVSVHRNRYSVAAALIGRSIEVRETIDTLRFFDGPKLVATHPRLTPGKGARSLLAEHRRQNATRQPSLPPSDEERTLRAAGEEFGAMLDRLRKHHGGQALRAVRQLHRLYLDYPTEYVLQALRSAQQFGLLDLKRIETLVLRNVREHFFRNPPPHDDQDHG